MNKKLTIFVALGLFLLPFVALASTNPEALALGTGAGKEPTPAANGVLVALEETLGQIYHDVSPSVVNIQVLGTPEMAVPGIPGIPGAPFEPSVPQGATGSGFVWDQAGHIVTNNHVVAGAEEITVTFYDDTTVPAEVVGTDPHSELAVIKVDVPPEKLHPVQVADSTQVRVGQLAVAIGNPFGLEGTMTVGFISALGRSLPVASSDMLGPSFTIPDVIQTDAPINPGNSGGVLVDDEGHLIGVPTAIESPVRANAGIGFAVPSVIVQKVVPVLISDGSYAHPWLGISGLTLNQELAEAMEMLPDQRGVLVTDVAPDGPADEAGLRGGSREIELHGLPVQVDGDLIVAVDGQPIQEFGDLITYLVRNTNVGDTLTLTLLRQGEEETVEVTLAARPQEQEPQVQTRQDTPARAWLGISGLAVTPEIAEAMDLPRDQQGVLVERVVPKSPAERAGLKGGNAALDIDGQFLQVGGDVIIAADDQPIARMQDLMAFLQGKEPGEEVKFSLLRDGELVEVEVTLAERSTTIS